MTDTAASRIYNAYRTALAQNGEAMPDFDQCPDKGRAWFAVANAVDRLREPPATSEAWDFALSEPISERKMDDGTVIMEQIPTSLRIRPMVTADLCAGDPYENLGNEAQENAQQAHIHGVELDMLEWRMAAADVEAAAMAITAAGGDDAAAIMRRVFVAAGGRPHDDDAVAWAYAAIEALSTDLGDHCLLQTRSPGVGTLKIGPIRAGHIRIYEGTAAHEGEWRGRIAALARVTEKPIGVIEQMRTEDAIRAWALVGRLKKKSATRACLRFAAELSSRSTAGGQQTSPTSPSPS